MAKEGVVYQYGQPRTFNEFKRVALRSSRRNLEAHLALPDPSEHLLPQALEFFNRFQPSEQKLFAASMAGVVRMKGLREKKFPIPEDFIETNLDHVRSLMEIAYEYHATYPELREHIDFNSVQKKLLVHDIGEAHPVIGDRPPVGRTQEDEQAKRLEPYAGVRILRNISDPELREETISHYKEYSSKDPHNIEVQMAAFIDKVQGTVRVAHIAFNLEKANPETQKSIREHLWATVIQMQDHMDRLLVLLPTQEAREAMYRLGQREFAIFKQYAPPEIAKTYLTRLNVIVSPGTIVNLKENDVA
ncbi:MAG: HD domain-containing protein [Candidatus Levyibacteriota bacterium]